MGGSRSSDASNMIALRVIFGCFILLLAQPNSYFAEEQRNNCQSNVATYVQGTVDQCVGNTILPKLHDQNSKIQGLESLIEAQNSKIALQNSKIQAQDIKIEAMTERIIRYLKTDCPEGWTKLPSVIGKCYQLSTSKANFDDAKASCLTKGAKLAEPMNYIESHEMYEFGRRFWIGVSDRTIKDSKFYFSLFCLLRYFRSKLLSNGRTPPYFNWANHEPNNAKGNQNCVTIGIHSSEKWDD